MIMGLMIFMQNFINLSWSLINSAMYSNQIKITFSPEEYESETEKQAALEKFKVFVLFVYFKSEVTNLSCSGGHMKTCKIPDS